MSVLIRRAGREDAAALARMRWEDSAESGTADTQTFEEFAAAFDAFVSGALASDEWVIWVAESEGTVVGHVYAVVVGMAPRPGRITRRWGHVSGVYVVPEERNQGIGARLLAQVIDWARTEGLEFLSLSATEGSVSLYERAGFVRSWDTLELDLQS